MESHPKRLNRSITGKLKICNIKIFIQLYFIISAPREQGGGVGGGRIKGRGMGIPGCRIGEESYRNCDVIIGSTWLFPRVCHSYSVKCVSCFYTFTPVDREGRNEKKSFLEREAPLSVTKKKTFDINYGDCTQTRATTQGTRRA